jgi:hypothetical protein
VQGIGVLGSKAGTITLSGKPRRVTSSMPLIRSVDSF